MHGCLKYLTLSGLLAAMAMGRPPTAVGHVESALGIDHRDAWRTVRPADPRQISSIHIDIRDTERELVFPNADWQTVELGFSPQNTYLIIGAEPRGPRRALDPRRASRVLCIEGWRDEHPHGFELDLVADSWRVSPDERYRAWHWDGVLHVRDLREPLQHDIGTPDPKPFPWTDATSGRFVWLPDSSGLVWANEGRLALIDLTSRSVRYLSALNAALTRKGGSPVPVGWFSDRSVLVAVSHGHSMQWFRASLDGASLTELRALPANSTTCSVLPSDRVVWATDSGLWSARPDSQTAELRERFSETLFAETAQMRPAETITRAVICGVIDTKPFSPPVFQGPLIDPDNDPDTPPSYEQSDSESPFRWNFPWIVTVLDGPTGTSKILKRGTLRHEHHKLAAPLASIPLPVVAMSTDGQFVALRAPDPSKAARDGWRVIPVRSGQGSPLLEVDEHILVIDCQAALQHSIAAR